MVLDKPQRHLEEMTRNVQHAMGLNGMPQARGRAYLKKEGL